MSEEQVVEFAEEPEVTEDESPAESVEPEEESTEQDDEQSVEEDSEEVKEQRRQSKIQRRIDKLTREKYELKGRLAAMEQMQQPRSSYDDDDRPTLDQYASQEDYIDALTDWKIEQKAMELEQRVAQRQTAASTQTEWNSKISAAQKQYPDWDDVMEDADDIEVGPQIQEAITTSKVGADVLYYLAKNRDQAQRITSMSPIAAAREIGIIEAKLEARKSQGKAPSITKAPKPPATVAAKGASSKDPDKMSMEEWKIWRNEQIKKRR